jgi:hypothetical protein
MSGIEVRPTFRCDSRKDANVSDKNPQAKARLVGGTQDRLPTALIVHLFKPHWEYTVVLDDHAVGKIGDDQERVFNVEPGEHSLHMRFVRLRRSKELRMSLKDGEERQYLVGTTGLGWPTLREASPDEVAEAQRTSISEPPTQGDSVSPN